jgi:peptidoglycan/xylan/chitin deacetylase (PgdA/CDA1 family)
MAITIQIKKAAADLMAQAGVLRRLKQARLKDKAVVLMYHRVLQTGDPEIASVQPGMYVTADSFAIHAETLRQEFAVIPLGEMIDRLAAGKRLSGCCSITFDDGWRDNYRCAFPIMKRWRLPATIFLATGFIGSDRCFWPDEVGGLLRRQPRMPPSAGSRLARLAAETGGRLDDGSGIEKAIAALKSWRSEERDALIAEMRAGHPEPSGERVLLDWDEAREMMAGGLIAFGAHTVNHVILDQVSAEEAEREIRQSREDLERGLGETGGLFAYPNGNTNGGIRAMLERCGFRGAVTTRKGLIAVGVHPLQIPRIAMHEDVSSTAALTLSRILIDRF